MLNEPLVDPNPALIWMRKYRAGTPAEQRHVLDHIKLTEEWAKNAAGDLILRGEDGRTLLTKDTDPSVAWVWWLPYGGSSLKFAVQKKHLERFAPASILDRDKRVRFESIFMEG